MTGVTGVTGMTGISGMTGMTGNAEAGRFVVVHDELPLFFGWQDRGWRPFIGASSVRPVRELGLFSEHVASAGCGVAGLRWLVRAPRP